MAAISYRVAFSVPTSTVAGTIDHGHMALVYDTADPVAIVADFGVDQHGPIRWVFARDVLRDGLLQRAGVGDVACWTGEPYYFLALSSPAGRAVLRLAADDVRGFLIDAEDLVPYGAERLDVDALLDRLLKDGAR